MASEPVYLEGIAMGGAPGGQGRNTNVPKSFLPCTAGTGAETTSRQGSRQGSHRSRGGSREPGQKEQQDGWKGVRPSPATDLRKDRNPDSRGGMAHHRYGSGKIQGRSSLTTRGSIKEVSAAFYKARIPAGISLCPGFGRTAGYMGPPDGKTGRIPCIGDHGRPISAS